MLGSELRSLMDSSGMTEEAFASHLQITISTLKYYLKPSVEVSDKVVERLGAVPNSGRELRVTEARQCVLALHKYFFDNSGTNVYGHQIPNFKVSEFEGTPRIHASHDDSDIVASGESSSPIFRQKPIAWAKWRGEFLGRCRRHKEGNDVEKKTLLLGVPGSGKTTVIKLLLINPNEEFTIVCLPLSIYNSNPPLRSVLDAAERHYTEHLGYSASMPFRSLLENEVNERRLVVLLDGYDEANESARSEIEKHVRQARFPTLITSRFVSPRLDMQSFTSERYYMGCLQPEDIRRYIGMVKKRMDESNRIGGEKLLSHLEALLDRHVDAPLLHAPLLHETPNAETSGEQVLAGSAEFREAESIAAQRPNLDAYAEPIRHSKLASADKERDAWVARHLEALQLMRTPILLNLYIASCVRDNNIHSSLTDLLSSYAKFLFGTWHSSRMLTPSATATPAVTQVEVEQALGVVAVYSLLSYHANGSSLTKSDAIQFLNQFFASYATWDNHELKEFVHSWLNAAHNANILTLDDSTQAFRFTAPHELLSSYYASVYLNIVHSYSFIRQQPIRIGKTARSVPVHLLIGYKEVASNPNLRYFQDAVVFLVQRMVTDARAAVPTNESILDDLLHTPPLSSDESGCTEDSMRKILPTGLIMAARAVSSLVKTRHAERYRAIIEVIRDQVCDLFLHTNIEYVYQSLMPLYRSLRSTSKRARATHSDRLSAEKLDSIWRSVETCEELLSYVPSVERIANGRERQKLIRRFVYRTRYLASSFDSKTYDWLKSQSDGASGQTLLFATLRMIRDNLKALGDPKLPGRIVQDIDTWVNEQQQDLRAKMFEYKNRLVRHTTDLPKAWNTLITDEEFDFTVLKWFPSVLESILPRDIEEDKCMALVDLVAGHLEDSQRIETPTEKSNSIQTKALFLLRSTAKGFRGQQYVLPPRCSLEELGMFYPKGNVADRSRRILSLLFRGAERAFDEKSQTNESAIAGWQLYDFYAQILWLSLSGLPSAARYDLLD